MDLPRGDDGQLALDLVSTIRHDGSGGVTDEFETDDQTIRWVAERWPAHTLENLDLVLPDRVRSIRRASRALLARAVKPGPPSRADSHRLMPEGDALAVLNSAAAAARPSYCYVAEPGRIVVRRDTELTEAGVVVPCLLALSVLDFLAGPAAEDLRACQAPRCVRYFLQHHGRQKWCKESCGNRARVAKHVRKRDERTKEE